MGLDQQVEENKKSLTREARAVTRSLRLAWWGAVVVIALLAGGVAYYTLLAGRSQGPSSASSRSTRRAFTGAPGRWGQLEYTRIAITLPVEFVDRTPAPKPVSWFFGGLSREQVEALLNSAELTPDQKERLSKAKWDVSSEGASVAPPDDVVLSLSEFSRSRLYDVLARDKRNESQYFPEVFYPEFLQERMESSDLPEGTLSMFRRLLYRRESWLLFSDSDVIAKDLPAEERIRLVRMVHRKVTYLVTLKLDERSEITAIRNYWYYPGRSKGLRDLLESVARTPGGGNLDVTHLLTPFARHRLYTFDDPSLSPGHDCIWSALNFWNEVPDERFENPEFSKTTVRTDYGEVSAPQFGDLVVLADSQDRVLHLANYIADDLVFTKNGTSFLQPWILMFLDTLRDLYTIHTPNAQPHVLFYRRKDWMN